MGYDYDITYKKGKDNVTADALSRMCVPEMQLNVITMDVTSKATMDQIKASWNSDVKLQSIIQQLKSNGGKGLKYEWLNEQLLRKGKLVIGDDAALRQQLLHQFHTNSLGEHSGIQATLKRMSALFYCKGMRKMVK